MNRPNIICFIGDQLRHDLFGCAGHPVVQTPNVDALARNGVRFSRCYTVQPMCMSTRSTLFTGQTPRGHRVRCNGIPLDTEVPTVTDALRQSGYRTHAIGKLHLNPWLPNEHFDINDLDPQEWPEALPLWKDGRVTDLPYPYYGMESAEVLIGKHEGHYKKWLLEREPNALDLYYDKSNGFESVEFTPDVTWKNQLPTELHTASWAAERAERFIDQMNGSDQPFLLWMSVPDPHPPYSVPDPYYSMYDPDDMPLPVRREGELDDLPPHYKRIYEDDLFTAGRIKRTELSDERQIRLISAVCGMVSQWDAMVGRVVEKLKENGMVDETVVIVTSDHGQMLGDHWMQNMVPTHLDGTARVPSIWHFPPAFSQGVVKDALVSHLDFAPTVLDLANVSPLEGKAPPQPEAEAQRCPLPGNSFLPLLTGKRQKTNDSVIVENDADYLGLRQRTVITERYHLTAYINEDYGELFDLENDPDQLYNLWDDPGHQNVKRDLLGEMMYRFGETDSVLPRRMGHA